MNNVGYILFSRLCCLFFTGYTFLLINDVCLMFFLLITDVCLMFFSLINDIYLMLQRYEKFNQPTNSFSERPVS